MCFWQAGDRLGKDHIDLALPALADHAKELLAPAGGGSCDALVREDVHHRPIRILHDLLGVEGFLVLIGRVKVCTIFAIFLELP